MRTERCSPERHHRVWGTAFRTIGAGAASLLLILCLANRALPRGGDAATVEKSWKEADLGSKEQGEWTVGTAYIPEDLFVREELEDGEVAWKPKTAITAKFFRRYEITLVDIDGDGRFTAQEAPFRNNRDGIFIGYPGFARGDLKPITPFRGHAVLNDRQYAIEVGGKDGRSIVLTEDPLDDLPAEIVRGVEKINCLRARAGLHGLLVDVGESKACLAHIDMLAELRWDGHTAGVANTGVGHFSMVESGTTSPEGMVERLRIKTYRGFRFYKRGSLAVGFGWKKTGGTTLTIGVMHVQDNFTPSYLTRKSTLDWRMPWVPVERNGRVFSVTVLAPAHTSRNPRAHGRHIPVVYLDPSTGGLSLGPPTCVIRAGPVFRGLKTTGAGLEFGKMWRGEFRATRVHDADSFHFFSEHAPIENSRTNWGLDTLFTKRNLKPGLYRVTFRYEGGVQIQWVFSAGK